MANIVTIIGASGAGIVSQVPVTSTSTYNYATIAAANISALISGGGTYGQASVTNGYSGSVPVVGSVGNFGTPSTNIVANVGTLSNLVQALVINNLGTTTAANAQFVGGETVLSGTGNLNFTDNGASTTIITGGGTNTVTFSSKSIGGTLYGDGTNTVNVNSASGVTSIYGTSSSTDTITGVAGTKITYTEVAGSTAIIEPNGANVTVFGGTGGAVSVFGGGIGGSLNVSGGTGYFAAGTSGGSLMSSGTLGSTTLVGGGNGDIMNSNGTGDVLIAGSGAESLNALNSPGGDYLYAGATGNAFMYGSYQYSDTFYTSTSTTNYVVNSATLFEGSFVAMHTLPNGVLRAANNVSDTLAVGFNDLAGAANYSAVYDFISGTDKVVLDTVGTGASYSLTYGATNGLSSTTLTTTNGSTILFYNAHVVASDVTSVHV